MCGIVGVVTPGARVDVASLQLMRDTMTHRGPDDQGTWLNRKGNVGLAHRRLSIIDTSPDGHQPMIDAENDVAIVFNGELYNYVEIRAELEQCGYKFRTGSDTEVILKAYSHFGVSCVERFNGMFAIAIWDEGRQQIVLFRDRLGIKPLFYSTSYGEFRFASELKALKDKSTRRHDISIALIDKYLTFGYVPGQNTLIDGIHRLLPGHHLVFRTSDSQITTTRYWDMPTGPEADQGLEHYVEQGKALLDSAVDFRLRSDVPLGAFLSGGLDSSAIVGLAASKMSGQMKTYSVAYDFGQGFDETPYARIVADKFSTDHNELFVEPEEFHSFIPNYVQLMDEPVTESSGISLYFLAKLASGDITVVLSGEGSDEIFAGYDVHRRMRLVERYRAIVGHDAATRLAKFARPADALHPGIAWYRAASANSLGSRYKGVSSYEPRPAALQLQDEVLRERDQGRGAEADRFLASVVSAASGRSTLGKMMYFDLKTWLVDDLLVKGDRMSMAASLELRTPFLDHRLVEFSAKLPDRYKLRGSQGKYILKQMVKDLLPREIAHRQKMGFPTPLARMFRTHLKEYCFDLLLSPTAHVAKVLRPEGIEHLLTSHGSGGADHHRVIWQLVVLEEWLQQNS